jgi:CBS domain-containing protein
MSEKRVRDIMLPLADYATIRSGCSIREALVALNKAQLGLTCDRHQHRAVLVLDPAGNVVGKLTHWAILRSLEPEPLREADEETLGRAGLSSEFIGRLKREVQASAMSLRRMCRAAGRVRVEDAMVPVSESIDQEAPLTAAIEAMVASREQSMLVRREGRAVGVLRLADLFEDVADLIREEDT